MKEITKGVLVVGAAMLAALAANAGNITIPDPHTDRTFGSYVNDLSNPSDQENDEVERRGPTGAYAQTGQQWDLESFDLTVNYGGFNQVTAASLSMTGGFNFDVGQDVYEMGDIFVYFQTPYTVPNGNYNWNGNDNSSPGAGFVGNDNWAYVIRFDRDPPDDTGTGSENGPDFLLNGPAGSKTVNYEILSKSEVESQGIIVQQTGEASALLAGLPLRLLENDGNTFSSEGTANYSSSGSGSTFHNTVSGISVLEIAQYMQLNNISGAYLFTTMACGNDVMWGGPSIEPPTTVPDGGYTLLTLGGGLLGLAAIRRRLS
jgi:hypothetical protein